GGYYGYHVWQWNQAHIATDDAYLTTHIVQISPQVSGKVTKVFVKENQLVHAGELLAIIDDSTFRSQVEKAQADLASAKAALKTAESNVRLTSATGDAQIAQAQGGVSTAQSSIGVAEAGVNQSDAAIDNARAAVARATNDVQTANATIAASKA